MVSSRDGLAENANSTDLESTDPDLEGDDNTVVADSNVLNEDTAKIRLRYDENAAVHESGSASQSLRELFHSVSLFSGFPDSLINQIKGATSIVLAPPETEILKQGEFNNNLYFLVLGTVEVYVDGGQVATLRRKGDLLGEMSVITNKACNATIVAKTPVEMICINTEEFRRLAGDKKDQFDHVLYRIYSLILTDKLNITNQKAKRLTETMDALQRAKTELQEINTQLERRVAERTQSLQTKLQELLNKHLIQLQDSLWATAATADAATRPTISKSIAEVAGVIQFIEPIVQRFNLEVSMKSKKVMLAQGDKRAQTTARMALGGMGVNIEVVSNMELAIERLKTEKIDVVLIDGQTLDLANSIEEFTHKPNFAYIANESIAENIGRLMVLPVVPNIVSVREADRAGSVKTITSAVTKLCSPNIFGFEKYLNVGAEIIEAPITHSDDRSLLNRKMKEYFSNVGVRGSVLDNVGTVLEEMLMNAIYDAPTDEHGVPIYNNLARTDKVTLAPNQQGVLRFATDGSSLAISVEDPFGALTARTILKYLDSCYNNRAGELQSNKGGAGRGLHQIVENSEYVVFNIHPKKKTEVIAFFDVVPGAKEARLPLLHYFSQH